MQNVKVGLRGNARECGSKSGAARAVGATPAPRSGVHTFRTVHKWMGVGMDCYLMLGMLDIQEFGESSVVGGGLHHLLCRLVTADGDSICARPTSISTCLSREIEVYTARN